MTCKSNRCFNSDPSLQYIAPIWSVICNLAHREITWKTTWFIFIFKFMFYFQAALEVSADICFCSSSLWLAMMWFREHYCNVDLTVWKSLHLFVFVFFLILNPGGFHVILSTSAVNFNFMNLNILSPSSLIIGHCFLR